MSVDYYSCECCGDSRYEEYVGECNQCGHSLCTYCLVNDDDIHSSYSYDYGVKCDGTKEQAEEYGYTYEDYKKYYKIGDILDGTGIDSKYCPFCNGDEINNDDLLEFIIDKYKLDKEVEIKEFKHK
ncbi:TPA: hypothetical protein LA460_000098 [Clostridium botulinum]|nr:hypothetical protein [Clostridium botulinum]HBJ1652703.1 hypothetical protein [Clostridium botulinum]